MKYEIQTQRLVTHIQTYVVEASSEEEARQIYDNDRPLNIDPPEMHWDGNEEVIEIRKLEEEI